MKNSDNLMRTASDALKINNDIFHHYFVEQLGYLNNKQNNDFAFFRQRLFGNGGVALHTNAIKGQ